MAPHTITPAVGVVCRCKAKFPCPWHHSKRRRRWGAVKNSTPKGHRNPKCSSAFVSFEKTQGPLVKVLLVPGWRPMKQLAVRVHFLRCGGLLDDWFVEGVLSLVFTVICYLTDKIVGCVRGTESHTEGRVGNAVVVTHDAQKQRKRT
ncbi:e3 ubiquitin-protein ligase RNF13 [Trichonephila clavipes]|nr:e3 ubiquitin-protein ligase RNF13 [Trichonephila clavipes]